MQNNSIKNFIIVGVIIVALLLIGSAIFLTRESNEMRMDDEVGEMSSGATRDEEEVVEVVEEFGLQLKNVSLMAPRNELAAQFEQEYAPFVTEELLNGWITDPTNAPGRLTSSPWPERIEVGSIEETASGYAVQGEVVFITSVELMTDGDAHREDVSLSVEEQSDGTFLISEYQSEAGE